MAEELNLANLGRSAWDFLNRPYRAPDENRTAGGRPAQPNFADRFVGNALMSLATLPERMFEASNTYLNTGYYDPAPIVEGAMLVTGTGTPFVARGALGSAGGRLPRRSLPADTASRYKRADEMGFRRDIPLYGATAPAGEQVAEAAIKVGDRVFTGPSHVVAIERAEAALGAPLAKLPLAPTPDGFVTTSGRFVSRYEAQDIAAAAGQNVKPIAMPAYKGMASEDLRAASASASARRPRHTTASTAPGLPGGDAQGGAWLALEPGEGTTALWHRAARPVAADVSSLSLPQIHATLANAWNKGFDAVMLKNYMRPGSKNPETVIVVRNQNQLRSPRAMFDPAKKDRSNILAGVGGIAAAGASLGAIPSGPSSGQEPLVY